MTICCQLSDIGTHGAPIRAHAAPLRPGTSPPAAMWLLLAACWGQQRLVSLPRDHHP
jgi:hypothetical protein